jgi:hypothetical protein
MIEVLILEALDVRKLPSSQQESFYLDKKPFCLPYLLAATTVAYDLR